MADVVDEYVLKTGKRQEGIFFAASSLSAKATSGVDSIVAGFALDIIQWPRGSTIRTAADVPAETIVELGLVYGPSVASFGFVSIWCCSHYRLTRERHAEILATLQQRRSSEEASSGAALTG